MERRGWGLVVVASVALGLMALVSNLTTVSQLSGEADVLLAVRSTISKLANAGAVWAGLPVLAGWLVRRPAQAAAAGVVAALSALVVHYGSGVLLGLLDSSVWAENQYWFGLSAVIGGPLGLVGAAARRRDSWGLLARLVVPLGAIAEPFFLRMFSTSVAMPWPGRVSSAVAGVVLLAAGVAGVVALANRHRRGASQGAGWVGQGRRR
ncbi:MAG: hypothetical protein WA966_10220 [Ornithinimicrobium sp.]